MSSGDTLVDRGADRLRDLSERAAAHGGVTSKLAQPLAEDSDFLRKLKPSLIKARAKGTLPIDEHPAPADVPKAPASGPKRKRRRGVSPLIVVGAALATGVLLAKWIDWRSHAHPRG
jgi:hypothetical protein